MGREGERREGSMYWEEVDRDEEEEATLVVDFWESGGDLDISGDCWVGEGRASDGEGEKTGGNGGDDGGDDGGAAFFEGGTSPPPRFRVPFLGGIVLTVCVNK